MVLRRAGLVRGIRGTAGGYVLGREPRTLTVGDVLRAFQGDDYLGCGSEEARRTTAAPPGWCGRCAGGWEAAVRDLLDGTTLADLEREKRRLDESQSMMLGI